MSYSSYNSYIVQTNGATLFALIAANYIAFVWNFRPLAYILSFRLIYLAELLLACLCTSNIWKASSNVVHPVIDSINVPFKNIAFAPGPLLTTIQDVYKFLRYEFTSSNKPLQPAPVAKTPIEPLQDLRDNVKFASMFLKDAPPQKQTDNITLPKPSTPNPLAPNYSLAPVFNQQQSVSNNPGFPSTTQQSVPKLKYTPCVQPPLQPSAHRERLLWFLSPTPEIVEDFRIQQMIDLQKNWNSYNDLASRVYYDKLTDVLLKKILLPLKQSIDHYNELLTPRNRSVANCPASTVLLSMIMPTSSNVVFTLPQIEDFITIPGHTDVKSREYVVGRIEDLASSTRLQTYRFIPTVTGMPTDSAIIMNIFTQYINLKEPYAIPPLVPCEGDLFKFLLVFLKITPELQHWNVFDLNDEL